jgi:hypothetical protein
MKALDRTDYRGIDLGCDLVIFCWGRGGQR